MTPKFSIIVPFKEPSPYLEECIESCLKQSFKGFELILLPNKPFNPKQKDARIRIIPTEPVYLPAEKRNLGAKQAKGEILAFVDDDAFPQSDWLEKALRVFEMQEKNLAALGGPSITPETDSFSQQASAAFFESMFGAGFHVHRYRQEAQRFVDDFPSCNLLVKKKAFFEAGGFNQKFWPGEDSMFCAELLKKGFKIFYSPQIVVRHHRRKILLPHLKQVYSYGLHRGFFAKKFEINSLKLNYFIPTIFLAFFVLGFLFSAVFPALAPIYLILLLAYFVLVFALIQKALALRFAGMIVTFFSHLAYGFAFLQGFFSKELKN